jgi:aminoglycoside phosphotransferase (APT) family kinase protein
MYNQPNIMQQSHHWEANNLPTSQEAVSFVHENDFTNKNLF